jgi:hypothetical protein
VELETMREKTFNMRLAPEEWARFESVAEHYQLPVASMLRMLVKEKYDALAAARRAALGQEHRDVLFGFSDLRADSPQPIEEIAIWMNSQGYDAKWSGLTDTLNELREDGYIKRLKAGYALTPKGRAYVQDNWIANPKK